MKAFAVAFLALTGTALAQQSPPVETETLPPPPAVTAPIEPPKPAPAVAVPWLPRETAMVQALDKVNARSKLLTVKVGQSVTFGTLTIRVKACAVRPPDAPADATAFLDISDSTPGAKGFSGWMLKATPAVSMMAHPIYDVRIVGCS